VLGGREGHGSFTGIFGYFLIFVFDYGDYSFFQLKRKYEYKRAIMSTSFGFGS
jgi:hypothetical protein